MLEIFDKVFVKEMFEQMFVKDQVEVGLPASASVSSSHGGKAGLGKHRRSREAKGKLVDGAVHVQEDVHVQEVAMGGVQGGRAGSCVASSD